MFKGATSGMSANVTAEREKAEDAAEGHCNFTLQEQSGLSR